MIPKPGLEAYSGIIIHTELPNLLLTGNAQDTDYFIHYLRCLRMTPFIPYPPEVHSLEDTIFAFSVPPIGAKTASPLLTPGNSRQDKRLHIQGYIIIP